MVTLAKRNSKNWFGVRLCSIYVSSNSLRIIPIYRNKALFYWSVKTIPNALDKTMATTIYWPNVLFLYYHWIYAWISIIRNDIESELAMYPMALVECMCVCMQLEWDRIASTLENLCTIDFIARIKYSVCYLLCMPALDTGMSSVGEWESHLCVSNSINFRVSNFRLM